MMDTPRFVLPLIPCVLLLCSALRTRISKSHLLLTRDLSQQQNRAVEGAIQAEMHACFHGGGGGGGGGRTRSVNVIRDLARNMKAMSLKVKAGGGGGHARARRRGRRQEAEEDLEMQDKDIAAAATAAASASAKIAPAQGHEADEDTPPPGDNSHRPREEERGGKRQTRCDKWCSHLDDVAEEEEEEAAEDHAAGEEESDREWVAEPEPGVLMTLVSRPDGTNHLRRLRFREELFDGPRAAQRWWADNYDSIVELYSIVQSHGGSPEEADEDDEGFDDEPVTPCQSEDDHHQPRRWQRLGCDSASTSGPSSGSGSGSGGGSAGTQGSPILGLVVAKPKGCRRERPIRPAQSQKCRSLHIN